MCSEIGILTVMAESINIGDPSENSLVHVTLPVLAR